MKRFAWLWGAFAGAMLLPCVWIAVGWLALTLSPTLWAKVSPLGGGTPFSYASDGGPSLMFAGSWLGGTTGLVWQFYPTRAARLLSAGGALLGFAIFWNLAEVALKSVLNNPQHPQTPYFLFSLCSYLLPLLWALGLLLLALTMRSRPRPAKED